MDRRAAARGRRHQRELVGGRATARTGARWRYLRSAAPTRTACERCGRTEWEGEPIPLHLDHINGEATDNRIENLRVLCPNCHAL